MFDRLWWLVKTVVNVILFKEPLNIGYLLLSILAIYLDNIIFGYFVLVFCLLFFLNKAFRSFGIFPKIALFLIFLILLYLSKFDKCFLIGFPLIFLFIDYNSDNTFRNIFFNTLLLVCIIENVYYLDGQTTYFYYFWGIPIIILSIIATKISSKIFHILFLTVLTLAILGQIYFNTQNYNKNIYTYSENNKIVANNKILSKYFKNSYEYRDDAHIQKKSIIILPVCESKILDKNVIGKGYNYIVLGEHDNLNDFIGEYPYINNDSFFRQSPWYLYSPIINSQFKYFSNKDIFYSFNIGATVNTGSPIIWSYNNWGKPILLATFVKINGSNVYVFGDSDFLVNKLIPYNLNFIENILHRNNGLFQLFTLLFIFTNILLFKNKKYASLLFFILMLFAYFLPLKNTYSSEIKIFSQSNYLTAHNYAYPTSILSILSKDNIAVTKSNLEQAQVLVLNKNKMFKTFQNQKLIYMMSDTNVVLHDNNLYCSSIKLGTEKLENNQEIVDSRLFAVNGEITKSGMYVYKNTKFVCSGSPQLNSKLTRSIALNENK